MRTTEERLAAMHNRANELEKQKRDFTAKICYISAAVVAVVAMVLIILVVPNMIVVSDSGSVSNALEMSGSIVSGSSALNSIIVGIGAFLLGVALTIFCYKVSKWHKSQDGYGADGRIN